MVLLQNTTMPLNHFPSILLPGILVFNWKYFLTWAKIFAGEWKNLLRFNFKAPVFAGWRSIKNAIYRISQPDQEKQFQLWLITYYIPGTAAGNVLCHHLLFIRAEYQPGKPVLPAHHSFCFSRRCHLVPDSLGWPQYFYQIIYRRQFAGTSGK